MCALLPDVAGSTPMPGRKCSTVLVVGSIGIRVTALHVLPSEDELITISFSLQPVRNRQSDHTTKTLPAPSIEADGRLGFRIPPASPWLVMLAICWLLPQLAPPFVELNTSMPPP